MSVATARGLLDWRAASGWAPGAAVDHEALAQAVWRRYLEWYRSGEWQGRAPGTACMTALAGEKPVDSKGCGGVMRVAPLGCAGLEGAAFEAGARAAALTHHHHTSDAASGFQALLVERLVRGDELRVAVAAARDALAAWPGSAAALERPAARPKAGGERSRRRRRRVSRAPRSTRSTLPSAWPATPRSRPTRRSGGSATWARRHPTGAARAGSPKRPSASVSSAPCALRGDFAAALRAAALISGDSDSTASIAGAILGAAGGLGVIPADWLDQVEGRDELLRLADDLAGGPPAGQRQ